MHSKSATPLSVGDQVAKVVGYKYPGEIRAVVETKAGDIRYVVECTAPDCAGMLHIFNEKQITKVCEDVTEQLQKT